MEVANVRAIVRSAEIISVPRSDGFGKTSKIVLTMGHDTLSDRILSEGLDDRAKRFLLVLDNAMEYYELIGSGTVNRDRIQALLDITRGNGTKITPEELRELINMRDALRLIGKVMK
jgi:hypothetical protein